ncbi:hypothetical protein GF324_00200 [bacterium]|nr:hypothetical protein [bacterium]
MTVVVLDSIGLCVHRSEVGDRAFDFAYQLVRRRNVPLNIFDFLEDPYDPDVPDSRKLSKEERDRILVEKEREIRFRYDERLGHYLKAGFRVCEDNEWTELHHCLLHREFQLLVLPCPTEDATFGGRSIQTFAEHFACPTALIGPDSPDRIRLNPPAVMVVNQMGLDANQWEPIRPVATPVEL